VIYVRVQNEDRIFYERPFSNCIVTILSKINIACLFGRILKIYIKQPHWWFLNIEICHQLRKESLNSDGQQFYQYQQNVQPPLTSNH
jgi:hypothetical protein